MSIFKRIFLIKSKNSRKLIYRTALAAGALFISTHNQNAFANGKSYVAVEPLTCDLVKAIALPSDEVTCLVERKQDVHDLKITPRQAQLLNNSDKVFTLGKEMTPTMRNWEKKNSTVVVGVSAIDIDDHAGHDDHQSGDFEWAGVFDLSPGTYKWSFAKVEGEYADPAMKMVILKSGDIEASEKMAKKLLGSKKSLVKVDNDNLVVNDIAYSLTFNQKKEVTIFNVEIEKAGKYAFFTEHMPFEFEAEEHFLKNLLGSDIEPIAQVPEEGGHHHHDHGGLDPHIWHDPHNIIKMGEIISRNLKKDISIFNRSDRKQINERFSAVDSILEELDSWIVTQVASISAPNRIIVSKHKAMEYYGDAFGFETISLLDFLGDSSSLRPENISSVLKELKQDNVKVLFPEQKPPSKLIKNLSRQSSIPLSKNQIFVDGLMLTGNTVSVAVHNTCTVVNSLGGNCDQKAGDELEKRWDSLNK